MALVTKIVVFGGDAATAAAAGVKLMLDAFANKNADDSEKTEFLPPEPCYLLAIVPAEYRLLSIKSTAGTIAPVGAVYRTHVEEKLFTETTLAEQLEYLPTGMVDVTWYGNSSPIVISGQEITAAVVPALADLSYTYAAVQYRLSAPAGLQLKSDDALPIAVVLYVEEILP